MVKHLNTVHSFLFYSFFAEIPRKVIKPSKSTCAATIKLFTIVNFTLTLKPNLNKLGYEGAILMNENLT